MRALVLPAAGLAVAAVAAGAIGPASQTITYNVASKPNWYPPTGRCPGGRELHERRSKAG